MKRIFYTTAILLLLSATITKAADSKKEQNLKKQQQENIVKIFELRKKLIQIDPQLKKLHDEKLAIHKQIAEIINSNSEMVRLIEKSEKIQKDLKSLKKPNKEKVKISDWQRRNSTKKKEPVKSNIYKNNAIDKTSDEEILRRSRLLQD